MIAQSTLFAPEPERRLAGYTLDEAVVELRRHGYKVDLRRVHGDTAAVWPPGYMDWTVWQWKTVCCMAATHRPPWKERKYGPDESGAGSNYRVGR